MARFGQEPAHADTRVTPPVADEALESGLVVPLPAVGVVVIAVCTGCA
jgi:hypothetical protein